MIHRPGPVSWAYQFGCVVRCSALYLSRNDDDGFSADDEELIVSLAATAGVAIENARLFAESHRRQDWLQASTEITRQLLASDGEEPLHVLRAGCKKSRTPTRSTSCCRRRMGAA